MDCGVCMENFDVCARQPILLKCGHSCCMICVKQILSKEEPVCPFDRRDIKEKAELQVNYALMRLLKKKNCVAVQERCESSRVEEIYCRENHLLRNFLDISEIRGEEVRGSCSFCKNPCSKNVSFCEICNFILCDMCSEDEKTCKRPENQPVRCELGHNLHFYNNSAYFYSRKAHKTNRIRCNCCRTHWVGGSWACRECCFDLCLNCLDRVKKSYEYFCGNGHKLEPCYKPSPSSCFVCTMNKNYPFRIECKLCDYVICEECTDYLRRTKVKEDVKCPGGHGLVLSEDAINVFLDVFGSSDMKCNGCKCSIDKRKIHHCRHCFYNLCDQCYLTIRRGDIQGNDELCGNGHLLRYFYNSSEEAGGNIWCEKCNQVYKNTGMFFCETCGLNFCVKCIANLLPQ